MTHGFAAGKKSAPFLYQPACSPNESVSLPAIGKTKTDRQRRNRALPTFQLIAAPGNNPRTNFPPPHTSFSFETGPR